MHELDDDDFEEESPTLPHALPRACMLVVDDDEGLRHLIAARMRRDAFDVLEAGSGHEAMDLLATFARNDATDDLDLLVLDNQMPGPTGLEIARLLRAAEWRTPIVLITAYPGRDVLAIARRLGVTVLPKPFPLDALTETVIAAMVAGQ